MFIVDPRTKALTRLIDLLARMLDYPIASESLLKDCYDAADLQPTPSHAHAAAVAATNVLFALDTAATARQAPEAETPSAPPAPVVKADPSPNGRHGGRRKLAGKAK